MGVGLLPEYGTEPQRLLEYAAISDLGKIAAGTHPGVLYIEEASGKPLQILALEEDPAVNAQNRTATRERLSTIGIEFEEVDVTAEHDLILDMIRKRSRG